MERLKIQRHQQLGMLVCEGLQSGAFKPESAQASPRPSAARVESERSRGPGWVASRRFPAGAPSRGGPARGDSPEQPLGPVQVGQRTSKAGPGNSHKLPDVFVVSQDRPNHAEPLKSQSRSLLGSCKKRCQGGAGLRSLSRACLLGFTVGVEESARLLLVFCLFALTLVWFPLK